MGRVKKGKGKRDKGKAKGTRERRKDKGKGGSQRVKGFARKAGCEHPASRNLTGAYSVRSSPQRFVTTTLPEKVVTLSTALPSPNTPWIGGARTIPCRDRPEASGAGRSGPSR